MSLCRALSLVLGTPTVCRLKKKLQNSAELIPNILDSSDCLLCHSSANTPCVFFDGIFAILWFIFGLPLVGLDALSFSLFGGNYGPSTMLYVSFVVSVFMMLFGFLIKHKHTK